MGVFRRMWLIILRTDCTFLVINIAHIVTHLITFSPRASQFLFKNTTTDVEWAQNKTAQWQRSQPTSVHKKSTQTNIHFGTRRTKQPVSPHSLNCVVCLDETTCFFNPHDFPLVVGGLSQRRSLQVQILVSQSPERHAPLGKIYREAKCARSWKEACIRVPLLLHF